MPPSPTLFIIYLDNLSQQLIDSGKGYQIPRVENNSVAGTPTSQIPAVFQADDIVLIGEEGELQELLDICTEFGKEFDVNFGKEKC